MLSKEEAVKDNCYFAVIITHMYNNEWCSKSTKVIESKPYSKQTLKVKNAATTLTPSYK